ncbi:hypothetical protein FGB62_674g00 [Gracilaria domingensis]|nr:hypothetical protein FGB62_674g00 [Gracilaria domingensis]
MFPARNPAGATGKLASLPLAGQAGQIASRRGHGNTRAAETGMGGFASGTVITRHCDLSQLFWGRITGTGCRTIWVPGPPVSSYNIRNLYEGKVLQRRHKRRPCGEFPGLGAGA